ncbi:TRAP transporter small permease subunit [Hydrogenophaga sp.]|uniref:TRAP transporter small permease subunit n=1 Tax=Hydrogenophaga sp. TaxID=1904254 RepID=UPI00356B4EF6
MSSESIGLVLPHWVYWGWLALVPLALIVLGWRKNILPAVPYEPGAGWFERLLDWTSDRTGLFVSLWSVSAVLAYSYEVAARYLFNMPTIWVHEASFLLFGMQYMMAGAYGLLHGSHVRVDVLYTKLSLRRQAALSVFTSVFFFIFVLAMMGTAYRFFFESLAMDERSVETWQIQYWPVKGFMLFGACLIFLAGVSRLIKDIRIYETQLKKEVAA